MKPWQCGFPLDLLKRAAAPFAACHKRFVHGAFGLVKERDVAQALAQDRFLSYRDVTLGAISSAAIYAVLKKRSSHSDFAGRPIEVYGRGYCPSMFVKAFAAPDKHAAALLLVEAIKEKEAVLSRDAPLYVEIFEEDEVAKWALLKHGFYWISTKVMAGSEIKGVYCRGMFGFEQASGFPHSAAEDATLSILVPRFASARKLQEVKEELERGVAWAQHYSSYNKRRSWTAFALRGYWDDPSRIEKPREMSRRWQEEHREDLGRKVAWLSIAERFPATLELVRSLSFGASAGLDRVRFMRLAAGGELTRHADITDRDAGVANGRIARLHVPIITNPGVVFQAWDARGSLLEKRLPEGCLAYLDQRKPHAVRNAGRIAGIGDRIHLVIDCVSNPKLREMIEEAKQ